MKHLFLATLAGSLLATAVQAKSPLQQGDLDLVINTVGETSAGLRYATGDRLGLYGLVRYFDRMKDDNATYNTTSQTYEDSSVETDPTLSIAAGLQYFVVDGAYLLGEVGYYTDENTVTYSNDAEETATFKGLDVAVGAGFEYAFSERFAMHSSVQFEMGGRDIESTSSNSAGTQVSGSKSDRSYKDIQYELGLTYTLN